MSRYQKKLSGRGPVESPPQPPQTAFLRALGLFFLFAQSAAAQDHTPPAPFELLIPANNAVAYVSTYGDKPRLAWQENSDKGAGLDHYEVWMDGAKVDTVPAGTFGHLPGEKIRNYEPFRPYGSLVTDQVYYYTPRLSDLTPGPHKWHVIAVDAGGNKRKCGRAFSFTVEDPGAAKDSLKIFVNHLGYLPGSTPRVVVDRSVAATSFEVVDADGDAVFSGKLRDGGGAFGAYLVGDITGLEGSGTCRIKAGSQYSMWFPIGLEAKLNYEDYLRKYRNAFRRKRCGNTKVNWGGKPCHLEDARMDGGERHELVGGWHVSSDVRKIMSILQPGMSGLIELKRIASPAWDSGDYSILDEIKWGNEFIHGMQLKNGAIGHHKYLWCGMTDWSESHNRYTNNIIGDADDRLLPEGTLVVDMLEQGRFIKNQTTIYRIYKDTDPVYAGKCLDAATRCYNYFSKTWPVVTDFEATWAGRVTREPVTDIMPLAYGVRANLYMHLAKGKAEYKTKAVALADELMALQETEYIAEQTEVKGFFYRDVGKDTIHEQIVWEGVEDAVIVLANLYEAFPTHPKAHQWKRCIRSYLEDCLLPLSRKNAFGIAPGYISLTDQAGGQSDAKIQHKTGGLHYQYLRNDRGTNRSRTLKAIVLAKGARILGSQELRDAAWRQVDWILGNNPLNMSTVYGVGHNQPAAYKEQLAPRSDGMVIQGIGGGANDMPYVEGGHWRWAEMELNYTAWLAWAVFELLTPIESKTDITVPEN